MFLKVDQQLRRADRVMRQRIRPHISPVLSHCDVQIFEMPGEPESSEHFLNRVRSAEVSFSPFEVGSPWGTTWGTTWFKVTGSVPVQKSGCDIQLVMDLGWYDHSVGGHIEGLAYREDGTVIKALHPKNYWIPLRTAQGVEDRVVQADGSFTIYVEAADNPLILGVPPFIKTELGECATGKTEEQYVLRSLDVCAYEPDIEGLWFDVDTVASLIRELDPQTPRYWKLVKALQNALNIYDERDLSTVVPARDALKGVLSQPASSSTLRHTAIGHAHIDSAWLWPVRETRRKVARTVSNVLALMDVYPDFKYAMSSAQQYAWLEEDHPDLFARVRQRVAEGRFIPVGGMWVEADGMMPAGESLIRQISFGKRYFIEKFGVEPKGVWLPDSFGYTGAWPQIAKRAGFDWFLTQKISWNDTTKFPHHTFEWEGIDGSRIPTHFPPSDTYAAEVTAHELHYSESNFQNKDIASSAMLLFGYGDGGGGPTREMMERLHRFENLEGSPTAAIGTPDDFFAKAFSEMSRATDGHLPSWKGELYLELHRGTLTSQQDMKRYCRQEESLLRVVEYLCAAARLKNADYAYPKEDLDGIWKTLLLNQFHDILPGSGIAWIYRVAGEEYRRDIARLREIAAGACKALEEVLRSKGLGVGVHQATVVPFDVDPSLSWSVRPTFGEKSSCAGVEREGDRVVMDNGRLSVVIESDGRVSSLCDLDANRQIVPQGLALGGYEIMRNEPSAWDAWEIERDALMCAKGVEDSHIVSARVDENGDAVVTVMVENPAADVTTTIVLRPKSSQLDFTAHVDWKAEEKFLKVDLPIALSPLRAQYECQYGMVERPIVKNTPTDEAEFESCTHRFIRLGEPGYGVSIVNASTYGADTSQLRSGTMVRLSLLSAQQFPDPRADVGGHDFAWSVVVDADEAQSVEAACKVNAPVFDDVPDFEPLVGFEEVTGVPVIDWMKLADDGSDDLIVRIYEAAGGKASAVLRTGDEMKDATVRETDVLERSVVFSDEPYALKGAREGWATVARGAHIELGPFQLATLRLHVPVNNEEVNKEVNK